MEREPPGLGNGVMETPLFQRNGPTTGEELSAWASENLGRFAGVITGDEGCSVRWDEPGLSYVVNIDSADGSGTHWVALRTSSTASKCAFWVDSLGFPPPANFVRSAAKNGALLMFTDSQNQRGDNARDATCGQRALLALREMDSGDLASFGRLAE